ncbi:unnamed protein product [Moneuplotes crassus]|uniref:Uncharacterized protein n=1 Tax=Euplotes crassus TaxID=5936 RepID=A0AAD1UMW2_EUPCR|nr:unnamed protein product [Moneuplotes crassus]
MYACSTTNNELGAEKKSFNNIALCRTFGPNLSELFTAACNNSLDNILKVEDNLTLQNYWMTCEASLFANCGSLDSPSANSFRRLKPCKFVQPFYRNIQEIPISGVQSIWLEDSKEIKSALNCLKSSIRETRVLWHYIDVIIKNFELKDEIIIYNRNTISCKKRKIFVESITCLMNIITGLLLLLLSLKL